MAGSPVLGKLCGNSGWGARRLDSAAIDAMIGGQPILAVARTEISSGAACRKPTANG